MTILKFFVGCCWAGRGWRGCCATTPPSDPVHRRLDPSHPPDPMCTRSHHSTRIWCLDMTRRSLSPLTSHCSLSFTSHPSLPTAYLPLLTPHHSPLTSYHSPLITHLPQLTFLHAPPFTHPPPPTTHFAPPTAHSSHSAGPRVRLVDARFLIALADGGGHLCPRPDLPEVCDTCKTP